MSRSQLARTPQNFPRMKYRAAGRHTRRDAKAALKAAPKPFAALGIAFDRIGKSFSNLLDTMAKAFRTIPTRDDYVLVPAPIHIANGPKLLGAPKEDS